MVTFGCLNKNNFRKMCSNENVLPEKILIGAERALNNLISEKSKGRYQKSYETFKQWQALNNVTTANETVMLAYFHELSEKYSPSSLWTYYSMLRSTISVNENLDIKSFQKMFAFIKRQNAGKVVKKAKVLAEDEFKKFLIEAKDDLYLLCKVVAIFGFFGACRCDEIYNLAINDLKVEGGVLIVSINKSKNYKPRRFAVVSEGSVNHVQIVKKYMGLRPKHAEHNPFFVFYNRGKCSTQRVGIHKIASIPKLMATFLHLPEPEKYTGHCLRRTSATILANLGGSLTDLKRLGGWKSSAVAEAYIEESVQNKIKIAKRMVCNDDSIGSSSSTATEYENNAGTTEIRYLPKTSSEDLIDSIGSSSSTATQYENNAGITGIRYLPKTSSEDLTLQGINISGCTVNFYFGKQV